MVLGLIVACEIGFWVAILAGLVARYPLRRRRLGAVLLALAPLVDVVLLVAVTVDLSRGATATFAHGLAALYIGVSVAYGHAMIRWADVRFAHRFDGGPAPVRLDGRAYAVKCWTDVLRTMLAAAVAAAIVGAMTAWVRDAERTEALQSAVSLALVVLVIDVLWAISYTVWPRRARAAVPPPNAP
ncbi:hypothetical protein CLV28_2703 [Sediminihabitans luteus]|uniref:Uncharacterized protein n=1 Tax=Sediminihabitans luteus TaxID=1138585 RepID=A0A2M9CD05_9CELL|nr:hypothetical protein [Sediminihabitans luteus]PJJ69240.1 hypothetical protein CLV28_2703 [Sediminihabitans luteus]GII98916.1 hypothetical protein Slu03_12940 [Sediminihabitans luteus]